MCHLNQEQDRQKLNFLAHGDTLKGQKYLDKTQGINRDRQGNSAIKNSNFQFYTEKNKGF